MSYILAIDQGTTSTRAIIFDSQMAPVTYSQKELTQYFPYNGWVEHHPEEIWSTTIETCQKAIKKAGIKTRNLVAIGITNQRETTLIWDKRTGKPIHNAVVWQDRRTAKFCTELKSTGNEEEIKAETGLLIDPYFSATKINWLLKNVDGALERAKNGDLLFGTVDSFLIWKMTGGKVHATDATNAARTLLYNIHDGCWSAKICEALQISLKMLPKVKNCADHFGYTFRELFGSRLPIYGVAGDQQAAAIGQACFDPGMLKATYGTGCFALLNTGNTPIISRNRLLTTIAYQLDKKPTYALEGSIFVAGAAVQWLRDKLGIVAKASETEALAEKSDTSQDIILVPAFTGLGAPYWNSDCRGAIFGLNRNSGPKEIARAALESVGFQTRDLISAMHEDWSDGSFDSILRVDGGMTANNWAMQFLSNILSTPVDRPKILETTALGAAWLAGMKAGVYPDKLEFSKNWSLDRRFKPSNTKSDMDTKYASWKKAVKATLSL